MSSEALNKIVLTLGEATVTLYPTNGDGSPRLDEPLWSGATAENLQVAERWLKRTTTPTGARQPRNHPLVAVYEITIGRVFALPLDELAGFTPTYRDYVLDVVWRDEEGEGDGWHRRTFYGVTISSRDFSSRDIDTGHTDNQGFDARTMVPAGGAYPVPALSAALPYQVFWLGAEGQRLLYTYDYDTQAFTAAAITDGRATLGYDGDAFEAEFEDYPLALETFASGLGATAFLELMPAASDQPRLDFFYGDTRVASLTPGGLWARSFTDGAIPVAPGQFALKWGGTVVATLGVAGVKALTLEAPLP